MKKVGLMLKVGVSIAEVINIIIQFLFLLLSSTLFIFDLTYL